jgi:hypothetical protein
MQAAITIELPRHVVMANLFRDGVPVPDIADRFAVQRSSVYKALRRAGALPPYGTRMISRVNSTTPSNPIRAEELPRVDRDPCPRCEVRGDIGCKHRRPSW